MVQQRLNRLYSRDIREKVARPEPEKRAKMRTFSILFEQGQTQVNKKGRLLFNMDLKYTVIWMQYLFMKL